ncbi:prokaryotic molybdopterin-containing oxidoreductase family, iron-sulfur binding subunit [Halobiforma haloterrestris]|uniref:Prokaryotic molybdopterin-containing oxidoreductase family, iron-sulfur binding subunit n=1 Tax=Natronobacterium haloterrestre TaxID=148448 RepID=A0A1I1L966_NATHA|nr:4Fe-4S dicluster domain-containing protein [Halobiforma haloterrestris]SFC69541.1 prokaryotic molybdopterin-containing oxidoreductase family, iron-sulfur binding subunit [Halobiforma haloterrestris]
MSESEAADEPMPTIPGSSGDDSEDSEDFDDSYDEMVDVEATDPRVELEKTTYRTDLGIEMAEDARRVSRGELSSAAYWEKYDDDAATEFGDDYRETPNPAVDRDDGTIDEETAETLGCSVGSMASVAAALEASENAADAESKSDGDGDGDDPRWGMVIDLQKCVGCESCTVACKAENRTPPGVSYNVVLEREEGEYPNVSRTNVPRPCMQCEKPPCVQVCPVSATYKMDNGVVNIDYDRCIGCRYCMVACPYDARYFDFGENYDGEFDEGGEVTSPEYGTDRGPREDGESPVGNVRKCNFCHHRLERGEEPACVETCVGDARYMGDLEDTDSDVNELASSSRAFQLKEKEGTDPNVYYLK